MAFHVYPLRLTFRAMDAIQFPAGKTANMLRGALGTVLDSDTFRPKLRSGPSGLADPPRAFVFRVARLDGTSWERDATFWFEMNVFDKASVPRIQTAVTQIMRGGIGPDRWRAELVEAQASEVQISFSQTASPMEQVTVEFLTPTELKAGAAIAERPEFPVLFARIRDRISTLCSLYGDGSLMIDFRGLAHRAASVEMTRCDLQVVEQSRRSSRTGQTHPLGGFIGTVEYKGDLTEFVPYLEAASYTGVGRQTVWGKGQIAIKE